MKNSNNIVLLLIFFLINILLAKSIINDTKYHIACIMYVWISPSICLLCENAWNNWKAINVKINNFIINVFALHSKNSNIIQDNKFIEAETGWAIKLFVSGFSQVLNGKNHSSFYLKSIKLFMIYLLLN